jgi:hypothetical protein
MIIRCVSKREPASVDTIYGTGSWAPQETKEIPDDIGKKMIRHTDVYVQVDKPNAPVSKVLIAPPSPDAPLQEVHDQLRNMSREQMKEFVQTKFNVKVDLRKYPTDDSMRAYATMLVEQYGVI